MLLVIQGSTFYLFSDTIPGAVVDVDEIYPPRPAPVKRGTTDGSQIKSSVPSVTALFTPDNGHNAIRNPTAPQIQRTGVTVMVREPL